MYEYRVNVLACEYACVSMWYVWVCMWNEYDVITYICEHELDV